MSIIKNIKNELVSNYFLNKTFARRFKSFDSLSYEPRFLLDLLPYKMNDYLNAAPIALRRLTEAAKAPERPKSGGESQWSSPENVNAPYLINTSVEYSVPIHLDTQMTINLFRNLIVKQAAAKAKARNKESSLLTFYLKGEGGNSPIKQALYRKNRNLKKRKNIKAALLRRQRERYLTSAAYRIALLTQVQVQAQVPGQEQSMPAERRLQKLINIILLKEIEKNKRSKFINTFASSLQVLPAGERPAMAEIHSSVPAKADSINLIALPASTHGLQAAAEWPRLQAAGPALCHARSGPGRPWPVTLALPLAGTGTRLEKESKRGVATGNIKLKNIVKVIQNLNLLKKIKMIRKIKEIIFNKNKQFYLERLVNEKLSPAFAATYSLKKNTKVPSSKIKKQVSLGRQSKKQVLAVTYENKEACRLDALQSIASTKQKTERALQGRGLGLRKLLLKSKLNSLQHSQSTNRALVREIITYNFNRNTRRYNIFNSFDFSGSSPAGQGRRSHGSYLNVSALIKYFFKTIGGAIISKPLFIFNHNKITIKFFYYLSKNIYFFSNSEKNKLLFLWLKNSNLEHGYITNIMKKYKNILAKNHNIPFK